ncbi:ABC transporter ATP-binding protein [Dethiothermospora halolimnae]|uniref:ABC transporter ATP-binding protein n=1 Tax=Dethiothermospora halolimnae TaxID=3114390 RepID=UPI003CCBA4A6
MEVPILEVKGLTKKIRGNPIIKGLDFTVESGKVFGFLGPNGAGKTTTLRMIVGLIRPTSGDVKICGSSILKNYVKAMSNVGCIIENPEMYDYMSGLDNLLFLAAMEKGITKRRIKEVVDLVGLKNRIKDKVSTYSLGMKQRLGIAQALLKKPKLLILDEPTNGLDPSGINEFRKLIKKLAYEEGMTVFVSSHLLSEIEMMCDQVVIIQKGLIVKKANVRDLLSEKSVTWEIEDVDKGLKILKEKWDIESIIVEGNRINTYIDDDLIKDINRTFFKENVGVKYVYNQQKSLEELFLEITEGDEIA